MAFRQRREKLRAILNGSTCIRPGSVYDATSIRIAEDLGFELGMFGGSVASLAVLGDPDIALITLTELAEQMRRMSRAATVAGAGRCRSRLWQCAQCPPHRAGTRSRRRRRASPSRTRCCRRPSAQAKTQLILARRGRRQDEGRARRARRSLAGHHGPHRRAASITAISTTPLRAPRPTRPPASMRCSSPASRRAGAGGDRGGDHACRSCSAARRARLTALDYLSSQRVTDRAAGPRAVRRRDASRLRDAESAARGNLAEEPQRPRIVRIDRPGHARSRREGAQRRISRAEEIDERRDPPCHGHGPGTGRRLSCLGRGRGDDA